MTSSVKQIDWEQVRSQFMLAPDEVYLNAGTFSALPKPVYERLVQILAEAEKNPTHGAALNKFAPTYEVQKKIAKYLDADPDDILFHINVTHALNQALFCLPWPKEGEFLISDLEYGAIVNASREVAQRNGLTVRVFELPKQPMSADELFDAVIAAVSPSTVGMLLSHVTAPTGMVMPMERIGPALRERKVRLIVDGAHAPGLIPVSLSGSGIDVYGGNLHKWFMGPKSTAFLYVDRSLHASMQPHIVGWGGVSQAPRKIHWPNQKGTDYIFQHVFQMQGLMDASPFLALEATLVYRALLGEEAIRGRIREIAAYIRQRLSGLLELSSPPAELNAGLVSFRIPENVSALSLQFQLYERHRITIATWPLSPEVNLLRVSGHICNSEAEVDRLAEALEKIIS